ncbi:hypothetical protein V6Z11_A05G387400 [Gossypium hirsutum]
MHFMHYLILFFTSSLEVFNEETTLVFSHNHAANKSKIISLFFFSSQNVNLRCFNYSNMKLFSVKCMKVYCLWLPTKKNKDENPKLKNNNK